MEFKRGNIVSLYLYDFQTFSEYKFSFSPNLNLIAAPNGSGKSTIANAIAFVFNGGPKTIGKSKDAAEFVRFGQRKAVIIAEVFNNGTNLFFKREIILPNINHYYINEKLVRLKDYLFEISNLGIDVNNLCNFLPQERVSEFCRMEASQILDELIENTTISFDELSNLKKELNEIEYSLNTDKKKHSIMEENINILETELAKIKEVEELEKRLEFLHYLKDSIEYKELQHEYNQLKGEIEELKAQKIDYENKFENLQENVSQITSNPLFKKHEENINILKDQNNDIFNINKQISQILLELEVSKVEISNLTKKEEQRKKEIFEKSKILLEIEKEIHQIDKMLKEESHNFIKKICNFRRANDLPDAEIEDFSFNKIDDIEKMLPSSKVFDAKIQQIADSILQLKFKSEQNKAEIDKLENEKLMHSQQSAKKMEMLKKYHLDTFKGVDWLRQNKNLFIEEVLEPAFLHVNIREDFSSEVETLLTFQSLSSFLVKNSTDFNTLTKNLKDSMKLMINVAEVVQNSKSDTLTPAELKTYGFDGLAIDFVEARTEYLNFLNSYNHLNIIPIAKKEIDENSAFKNLKNVKKIIASGRYSEFKKSKYGDDSIIISNKIVSKGTFNSPKINIDDVKSKLDHLSEEREKNRKTLSRLLDQKTELEYKKNQMLKELDISPLSKLFYSLKTAKSNLEYKKLEFEKLNGLNYLAQIEKIHSEQINKKNLAKNSLVHLESILEPQKIPRFELEKINDLFLDLENNKRHILVNISYRENLTEQIEQNRALKEKLKRDITTKRENITSKIERFKNFTDEPPQKVEIQEEIEFIFARLEVLNVNTQIKVEHARKEKNLNEIKHNIQELQRTKEIVLEQIQKESDELTTKIYKYLKPINQKFEEMFQKLGFSGRIELEKSDPRWGMNIMVKFRENEMFQKLSSTRQSGGEKSLTTVIFLLSLQQCQEVPFRLVDEINQGMDAHNEKKVYELLKEMSSTSQFFIITPKLIEDLVLSENARSIVIFGSCGINKQIESHVNQILNNF